MRRAAKPTPPHRLALARRAQQGDRDALEALIADMEPNLWILSSRFATTRTARPDIGRDDLVQLGRIAVLEVVEVWDGVRPFEALAHTAAWRSMRHAINRNGRSARAAVSLDYEAEDGSSLYDAIPDPADAIAAVEAQADAEAHVDALLAPLSARRAQVIRARYGLGGGVPLSVGETAASVGSSRVAVVSAASKAVRSIRAANREAGDPERGAA